METEIIQKQIEDLKNKAQLTRRDRRYLAKLEAKHRPPTKNNINWKGTVTKILLIFVGLLVLFGMGWYVTTRPNLPPIDLAGHIEESPPSHILDTEMTEPIQKHMLEHADGSGAPGIVIQYNCKKYNCEKNLVDKLEALVKKYPENVYLAPGNYDGKIILTKLGKREILSAFNEKSIADFILDK